MQPWREAGLLCGLRAEGWEWSGGLPDICPHLALLLLGDDLLLTREHLHSTQTNPDVFPSDEINSHERHGFCMFSFTRKMISHQNSRIIVFQGSQSHWYLHYDQLGNRKIKSMPLEIPSLTGLQTQHLGGAAFLSEVRARRGPVLGRNLINSVAVPPLRGTSMLHLVHDGDICTNLE